MKPIINSLAMALLEAWPLGAQDDGITVGEARAFAEAWVTENAELFVPASTPGVKSTPFAAPPAARGPDDPRDSEGEPERARVHKVSIVGDDGLTDKQRAAVGNVGLCPNCQQPNNAHLPGCARASGEAPNAKTVNPLPPVE